MITKLVSALLCMPTGRYPTSRTTPELETALKDIPVFHRSRDRGHGREEVREVQVCSIDGLLIPRPPSRVDPPQAAPYRNEEMAGRDRLRRHRPVHAPDFPLE